MPVITLISHPATPCPSIRAFYVHCERSPTGQLVLTYRLEGALESLSIPLNSTNPARRDELWRHSCCEVFIAADGGPDYWEYNFSPSGDWAFYHFTAYREGMDSPPLVGQPGILVERGRGHLTLRVTLDSGALGWAFLPAEHVRLALSAVIETRNGALSYWALRHPPGKPDFHHPESFALRLPA